jgi:hypothetical protein
MRVLVLLGFAATDFVITMTLSAADAAKHAIENPFLYSVLGEHQLQGVAGKERDREPISVQSSRRRAERADRRISVFIQTGNRFVNYSYGER